MSQTNDLKSAMRHDAAPSRREIRAARTRAQALSPMRILLSVLSLPFVATGVAMSLYVNTSPFDPPQALAHLVARVSCDAAATVNLAPAYRGGLGYHARNDHDGDGVACESVLAFGAPAPVQGVAVTTKTATKTATETATAPATLSDRNNSVRRAGGAKFVRP